MRCHLLPSGQTVVDAVRKLPDKQEWLSSLLLQLALGQLEVSWQPAHAAFHNFNILPTTNFKLTEEQLVHSLALRDHDHLGSGSC